MNDEVPHISMECMNCRQTVRPEDAKLFAEVFVCPTCHAQAVHFWEKLERELRYLLVVAKESIRLSLLEGKFFFPEDKGSEVSKREVLQEILRMQQAREEAACKTPTTISLESSPPVASTPDALVKQSSNTPSRQD